jgi:hypothetical protein
MKPHSNGLNYSTRDPEMGILAVFSPPRCGLGWGFRETEQSHDAHMQFVHFMRDKVNWAGSIYFRSFEKPGLTAKARAYCCCLVLVNQREPQIHRLQHHCLKPVATMFNRPLGPRNKLVLPLPLVVLAITIIPNFTDRTVASKSCKQFLLCLAKTTRCKTVSIYPNMNRNPFPWASTKERHEK